MQGYQKKIRLIDDMQQLRKLSGKNSWAQEWDFEKALLQQGKVILVTNPLLQISFASSNLPFMNGYQPEEVTGKTPKIFQGVATSPEVKREIHTAIGKLQSFHVSLLNYRKNGSVYDCDIEAYPVFNKKGRHIHFIAFEKITGNDP